MTYRNRKEEIMEAIKIEDFLHYANLGKLKAKGQSLVWVKGLPDAGKKDKYLYTLETLKDGQVTPLSSFGQEKDFVFLDENTVCFAGNRTRKKGKSFIYQLSLTGGEAREIAALGGDDFAVENALSDGRLLLSRRVDLREAEKKQDPDEKDYVVLDEFPAYFNGDGIISKFRDRLFLFDPAKNELTELLTDDPYFNFDLHYVDGSALYFTGDSYTQSKARKPALYQLDLNSLEYSQLLPKEEWSIFDICVLKGQLYLVATDEKRYGSEENPQFYTRLFL